MAPRPPFPPLSCLSPRRYHTVREVAAFDSQDERAWAPDDTIEPCAMAKERRRVSYSGRVQGVGFRFTARRLATAFAVGGYVRNLPDGRVELIGEGEPAVLDDFLAAVRSKLGGKIQSAQIDIEPPGDSPFDDFSIHY